MKIQRFKQYSYVRLDSYRNNVAELIILMRFRSRMFLLRKELEINSLQMHRKWIEKNRYRYLETRVAGSSKFSTTVWRGFHSDSYSKTNANYLARAIMYLFSLVARDYFDADADLVRIRLLNHQNFDYTGLRANKTIGTYLPSLLSF